MQSSSAVPALRAIVRPRKVQACLFSTTRAARATGVVPLAYTRHDPPSPPTVERPPVLILHGLFGSQRNNRTMSKVLARDLARPVYTLDLRNHGDSPHSAQHDYSAMAADVEHFLESQQDLATSQPTLLGHSMGAKVAMTMALRRPSAYSALIPVDNAPVDAALKSDFNAYVRAMKEVEERIGTGAVARQSDADKILAAYEDDMSIRQFLLTNLVKASAGGGEAANKGAGLRWRVPLATLAKSLPAMADFPYKDPEGVRYEGPTLIVRGSKSHYVSDESLPLIGRFFPRFELLEIDAGHWVMSEKFEDFRAGVVEWMGRVVDRE